MSVDVGPDILELARRVDTSGHQRFVVDGMGVATGDEGTAGERVRSLANALYKKCYCRPSTTRAIENARSLVEARDLLASYSRLNRGKGTKQAGWRVLRLDPSDGRCVAEKHGITLWLEGDQVESSTGEIVPGMPIRVQVPKELQRLIPGFYAFVGDAPADDEVRDASRFYWHITRAGAPLFVDAVSSLFNRSATPFSAKILSDPGAFLRADVAVLYLGRRDLARAWPILQIIYGRLQPYLRSATPMFTCPLAPGLGVADDVGDTVSFGLHRCELVATALVGCGDVSAATHAGRTAAIVQAFVGAGLSPSQPHLRSTDSPPYPPFDPRPS